MAGEDRERRVLKLVDALGDNHVSAAWNAARELAKMGTEARSAVPALERALSGADRTTALWARFALAQITGEATSHLPFFIQALADKRRIWAGMAATALSGFGVDAAPAVDALIPELNSPRTDD